VPVTGGEAMAASSYHRRAGVRPRERRLAVHWATFTMHVLLSLGAVVWAVDTGVLMAWLVYVVASVPTWLITGRVLVRAGFGGGGA
jgi:hypothetical protein